MIIHERYLIEIHALSKNEIQELEDKGIIKKMETIALDDPKDIKYEIVDFRSFKAYITAVNG